MQSKRDAILENALRLFEQEGVHSIGIERIIAEAGVTKMTLYNHFRSKDALIVAALLERDRQSMASLKASIDTIEGVHGKVRGIFEWHDNWFNSSRFRGCVFLNTASEVADRNSEIRKVILDHKISLEAYIASVLKAEDVNDPAHLAELIMMLIEGATVMAYAWGRPESALLAWKSLKPTLFKALSYTLA